MEIGAEFEKEMSYSEKISAKIARCFIADNNKTATKGGLCLPSSVY